MERRFAVLARPSLIAVALSVNARPIHAAPQSGEAKVQFDKGVALYSKGEYQDASRALSKSYALKPDAETLFAWAQAERKLEHCDRALELYAKLLKFDMPPANRDAVKNQVAECKDILAKASRPEPKPEKVEPKPDPVEPPPEKTEPVKVEPRADRVVAHVEDVHTEPPPDDRIVVRHEPRAWWKDPVGGTLFAAGVAGLGVSAYFLFSAQAAEGDKADAMSYSEFKALDDKATQRGEIGMIALATGGVLLATSFTWYATHRHHGDSTVVTGWVAPGQGGLAITGGF